MQSHWKCTDTILCLASVLEAFIFWSFYLKTSHANIRLSSCMYYRKSISWELCFPYAVEILLWRGIQIFLLTRRFPLPLIKEVHYWSSFYRTIVSPLHFNNTSIYWYGLVQFLLAQIWNNWCSISSLAILCDDADAFCTWKAESELGAKSSYNGIRMLYKNMYIDNPILWIPIKRNHGCKLVSQICLRADTRVTGPDVTWSTGLPLREI